MDMRSKSLAEINTLIMQQVKNVGAAREEAINDLAKIAIWHSIKDGQVTPAMKLYGALCRGDNKQGIVAYMAKHGNIGFGTIKGTKVKGIKHVLHHAAGLNVADSLAFANQVYENLPDFWVEHAAPEPVVKDYDVHAAFMRLASEVRARMEAGKQALTKSDDEKALLDNILVMFPKTV